MADNLNAVTSQLNQLGTTQQRTNELLLRMDSNFSNGIDKLTGIMQVDAQYRAEERRDQAQRDKNNRRIIDKQNREAERGKNESFSMIDKLTSSFFGSLFGVTSYAGASGALGAFAGKYGWLGLIGGAMAAILMESEKEGEKIDNAVQKQLAQLPGSSDELVETIRGIGGYNTMIATISGTSLAIKKSIDFVTGTSLAEASKEAKVLTGIDFNDASSVARGEASQGLIGKTFSALPKALGLLSKIFYPISMAFAGFEAMSRGMQAYEKAIEEGEQPDVALAEAAGAGLAGVMNSLVLQPLVAIGNITEYILNSIGLESTASVISGLTDSLKWLMDQLYIVLPSAFGGLYNLFFKEKSEEENKKSFDQINKTISGIFSFMGGFLGIELDSEGESIDYVKRILQVYNFFRSLARAFIEPLDSAIGKLADDISFEFKDFWDAETPEEAGRAFRKGLINTLGKVVENTILYLRDVTIGLIAPVADQFVKLYNWTQTLPIVGGGQQVLTTSKAYEKYLENFDKMKLENENKLDRGQFIYEYLSGNLDRFFDKPMTIDENLIKTQLQAMGLWREYNKINTLSKRAENEVNQLLYSLETMTSYENDPRYQNQAYQNRIKNRKQVLSNEIKASLDEFLNLQSTKTELRRQAIEALNKQNQQRGQEPVVIPMSAPGNSGGQGNMFKTGAEGSSFYPMPNPLSAHQWGPLVGAGSFPVNNLA